MLRIGAIVLQVSDTSRAGDFWSQALGYRRGDNPDFLLPAGPTPTRLHLDATDGTHLDLWTDSAEEQQAEVARLIALGATEVEWDYPPDADFIVLADPDGSHFCVIDTSAPDSESAPMTTLFVGHEKASRVLLVHAHPDDETLATGALIAELVARGVEVHVVTATRGERGELRPGVADVEPGSEDYVALRERELTGALRALGVGHHAFLGMPPARLPAAVGSRRYRDSGMRWIREGLAGPAEDAGPESLTAATVSDAAADLAAYVEATRPGVLITYDAGGGYGHPDHVRTHEVTREVARAHGIPMIEVIPPDRGVDGDPTAIEWRDLSNRLAPVQDALRCHATQVAVDGNDVVHVGGQREPIVTRVGLRRVAP